MKKTAAYVRATMQRWLDRSWTPCMGRIQSLLSYACFPPSRNVT